MTSEKVTSGSGSLGGRAARGGAVTFLGQAIRIVIQMLSVVILARLLSTRDFGLLTMVTAVMGIFTVFRDLGLSTAAVRARTLSQAQRDNLFWINTAAGLVLSLGFVVAAPLIARANDEPRLVPICHAMAWTFLLSGLAVQYRADLNRKLEFGRIAATDVLASAMGLVAAVAMALGGFGYWALVAQQIAQLGVMLLLLGVWAGWLPGRPTRSADMGGLLRFGWQLFAAQTLGYGASNVDSVTIGVRFGASPLGLYSRAFQLIMSPLSSLRGPLTQVALPVFARVREDSARFQSYIGAGQIALGYTMVAGLGVVVGGSHAVVAVFLGAKWLSVWPVMSLLALAGAIQTSNYVSYWVFLAEGRTDKLMSLSVVEAVVTVVTVVSGSIWGITGVAAGYALSHLLIAPLRLWWLRRYTGVRVVPLARAMVRVIAVLAVVSACAGLATRLTWHAHPAVSLLAAIAGGLAGYAVTAVLAPVRRDFADLRTFVQLARG